MDAAFGRIDFEFNFSFGIFLGGAVAVDVCVRGSQPVGGGSRGEKKLILNF
jgi:hypothetical protein